MRVALISSYELGRQPLGVASPAAALRAAGHTVRCLDLAVDPWDPALVRWADAVALSVPMHTAMRLAVRAAAAARTARPDLPVAFYGLYAPLAEDPRVGAAADVALTGEYEPALVAWVDGLAAEPRTPRPDPWAASGSPGRDPEQGPRPWGSRHLGASTFHPPARDLLPPLERYAHLSVGGEHRLVGAIETTHGCRHLCRHCPIPPVYGGRIAVVGLDVLLADVEALVRAGASHVTFADADFLNAPAHAQRVVAAVHDAWPHLTWDATVKVEHVLRHRELWPGLAARGGLFVVSAFEALDDEVLKRLDKGHTRADATEALAVLRDAGIEPRPTWLPFTPWTRPEDLAELVRYVVDLDLLGNVDPVQYTVRLLLPAGSLLLSDPTVQAALGPYDPAALTWTWTNPDPQVDALQRRLAQLVEADAAEGAPAGQTFLRVWREVMGAAGTGTEAAGADVEHAIASGSVEGRPRMTEPWFC